jgi:hypothetical protein
MPARRRSPGEILKPHGKRKLGALAASAASLLIMLVGVAASPALAAPAPAVHLASPPVQSRINVVHLAAAQCRDLGKAIRQTQPGAAPMKKCEIGTAVFVQPIGRTTSHSGAAAAAASSWQDFYAYAIDCFGDTPVWNAPSNSASCEDEGYVGLQEEFAGNGSWMNLHWINPTHYASQKFSFTKTWQGVSGNNTTKMTTGDNWDYSSPIEGTGSMELRIVNYYCHGGASMCFVAEDWWQGP